MDFVIDKSSITNNTMTLDKASATVIAAGSLVSLTSGLAVTATAISTILAYCPAGGVSGETTIEVIVDPTLIIKGVGSAAFAVTNRSAEVDLIVPGGIQTINLAATVTKVLRVLPGNDAGTVGSTADIKVVINKPLI